MQKQRRFLCSQTIYKSVLQAKSDKLQRSIVNLCIAHEYMCRITLLKRFWQEIYAEDWKYKHQMPLKLKVNPQNINV